MNRENRASLHLAETSPPGRAGIRLVWGTNMKRETKTLQLAEMSPPGRAGIRLVWGTNVKR